MVPPDLVRSPTVVTAVVIGFTFMVGYYGLPFLVSLFLQQQRGLSSLAAGATFVPMMVTGLLVTLLAPALITRIGIRAVVVGALILMAAGLLLIGLIPATTPVAVIAVLMVPVGAAAPMIIPPVTARLLNSVSANRSGTASGIFNTSRQVGGALAVAVFGALLASSRGFDFGFRLSLLLAASVVAFAAAAGFRGLRA